MSSDPRSLTLCPSTPPPPPEVLLFSLPSLSCFKLETRVEGGADEKHMGILTKYYDGGLFTQVLYSEAQNFEVLSTLLSYFNFLLLAKTVPFALFYLFNKLNH